MRLGRVIGTLRLGSRCLVPHSGFVRFVCVNLFQCASFFAPDMGPLVESRNGGGGQYKAEMKVGRVHRVAGVSFGKRAASIQTLLAGRNRRYVQCRLSHHPSNPHDSEAVAVVSREGGCDIGFLARGSLPPGRARQVDGDFARVEIGRCKAGVGVYARVFLLSPPMPPPPPPSPSSPSSPAALTAA